MRRRPTMVALIVLATLIAVGALCATVIQVSYDSNLATERSRLSATAQVTADLVAQQMTDAQDIEQATLAQPEFTTAMGSGNSATADTAGLQAVLDEVQTLRPEFQFAAVSDAAGSTLAISPPDPGVIGKNFSYRDWYHGAMRTGRTYVSSAYVSAVAGAPLVVAVATPIRVIAAPYVPGQLQGPVIGILFIGYRIDSVQALAQRLASAQQIGLEVTDQAGIVIARPGGISGHLASASASPEIGAALAGRATTSTTSSAIAAGIPVVGIGWAVSASTPLSATAAAEQRGTTTLIAVGLLLVLTVAGAVLVIVTRRLERARSGHETSEAELRSVQHSLTDSVQVISPAGVLLSSNPAAARLFELEQHQQNAVDFAAMWELLREDGSLLPVDERPLGVAMRTGEITEGVVVGIRKRADHTVRWLSTSTVPIRGPGGTIPGYVYTCRDITERVDTIRELQVLSRASEQMSSSLVPLHVVRALTRAAAELCSAPGEPQRRAQLLVIDGATMIMTGEHDPESPIAMEGTCLAIVEHPYAQRVIATRQAAVAAFDYDEFGPGVAGLMRRTGIHSCAWVPLIRDDGVFAILAVAGRQHVLVSRAQLERLRTLATIGALALSNAEAHVQVAELARTDPLTGVGNRRALDERLAELPRTRFALVAIDVDDLKKVNDAHGHDAGDEMLSRLAAALAAELRPGDMLARTGGDEFVALLMDCDTLGAIELSRRLQRATAGIRLAWGTPTISVGSAAGADGESAQEVAKVADLDLYAAKQEMKARALLSARGRETPPAVR